MARIEVVRLNDKLHVAILYICTGKYSVFWEEFYRSTEKYFLRKSAVEYYVFTDADKLYDEDRNVRIHRIKQENLGWPGNTLFRFRMFVSIEEKLEDYDYLFSKCEYCMQTGDHGEGVSADGTGFVGGTASGIL